MSNKTQSKSTTSPEELAKLAEDAKDTKGRGRAPFEDVVYPRPKGGPCAAGFIVEGEMVACSLELGHDGTHQEEA